MWLDLDFTHGVVVSRGRGNVGYKILSLARAKGVTALGRKKDMHLTWYSNTYKREIVTF